MSVRPRERAMSDTADRFMSEQMGAPECCLNACLSTLVGKTNTRTEKVNTVIITTCIGAFGGLYLGNKGGKPLEGMGLGAAIGFITGVTKVAYDCGRSQTESDATDKKVAKVISNVCIGGGIGLGIGIHIGKPLEAAAIGAGTGLVIGLSQVAYDSYRARH